MIITVASFKGGVGKTTSAVHIAAYLQQLAPCLLIDGDPNRSASEWARRGGLPVKVIDERQGPRYARDFEHIVIDTAARPERDDLKSLADGCDLLILPSTPDALSLHALIQTVVTLQEIGADRYRVLLTMVPARPSRDGEEARATLTKAGLPVFAGEIRRRIAFQKAALAGVPVNRAPDPRAAEAWSEYEAIGKELRI